MKKSKMLTLITICALTVATFAAVALADVLELSTAPSDSARGWTYWVRRDVIGNASTAQTLYTAPGEGKRLNVTRVIFSTAAATALYLVDEDDNTIAGGYAFTTSGPGTIDISFPRPRYLEDNKALKYKATATGAVLVEVEGFTSD